jgi:hypothetical protein
MDPYISFGNANAGLQAGIINGNVVATYYQAPGELRNYPRAEIQASKQALTNTPPQNDRRLHYPQGS